MSSVNSLHRRKLSRENEGPQSFVVTENDDDLPQTQSLPDPHAIQIQIQIQNTSRAQPLSPHTSTTSPFSPSPSSPNGIPFPPSPSRQRVLSTPSQPLSQPIPLTHRSSFGSANHHATRVHARAPSMSSSVYPPGPSPLAPSYPLPSPSDPSSSSNTGSNTGSAPLAPMAHRPAPLPPKRHTRIHSRNLSVYFPRPGAGPPSIAEDGIQEDTPAPETLLSSSSSSSNSDALLQQGRELSSNFTFGGKKTETGDDSISSSSGTHNTTIRVPRRGHHHKHSLSHNFFSFMEPESHDAASFTSGIPTPSPSSGVAATSPTSFINPWTEKEVSSPQSAPSARPVSKPIPATPSRRFDYLSAASALAEFVLGVNMWIRGQLAGSLSCTGLGYWVVFDAFGIAIARVLPKRLASGSTYENARIETLAMFAQSIYLIFASVYVCKEAVEHALLTHDQGRGHHHHHGDELEDEHGIDFDAFTILFITVFFLMHAVIYDNNSKMANATSNRLPNLTALFEPEHHTEPSNGTEQALSNPYAVIPIVIGLCILGIWGLGNVSYHRRADLLLAFVIAVITFWASYPAAVALGKILLQTAPERSNKIKGKGITRGDGRMEAFLRLMREFEKHPQIQHLPPPHIWQLTPPVALTRFTESSSESVPTLIITLELHVSQDLDDESILKLTRWAWERCMGVLGGAAEVTVGIVRG